MRGLSMTVVLGVLAFATSGCGASPNDPKAAADSDAGPVTVKYMQASDSFAYLPFYIASGEGFFEQEGIEIDRQPNIGVSSQAAQSVVANQAEIAAVGTSGVYGLIAQGRPAKSVAALTQQSIVELALRDDAVERLAAKGVAPDAPIEERVQALKGLKIAIVPEGAVARVQFESMLKAYGLDPTRDVTLIPVEDPQAIVATAKQGRADGFVFSLPNTQVPVTDDWGATWISFPRGDVPSLEDNYLIDVETSEDFLKANPQVVERFLAALQRAFDLLKSDPAAAKASVQKAFPDMDPKLFDAAYDASLPAFANGMVPTEEGFVRTEKLWRATQDKPVQLTFSQVYDTKPVLQATQAKSR